MAEYNVAVWVRDNGDGTYRLITDPAEVLDTDIPQTIQFVLPDGG